MIDIVIGILHAIGGYARDFRNMDTRERIVFLVVLICVISLLVAVLVLYLKSSTGA